MTLRRFSLTFGLTMFLLILCLVAFGGRSAVARITHGGLAPTVGQNGGGSPFHYPLRVDAAGWKVVATGRDSGSKWTKAVYAGVGDQVPAILIEPAGVSAKHRAPVLLLIHGLGGRKEDMLPVALLAAQDGYASLLIDLPGMGDRKSVVLPQFASLTAFTTYVDSYLTQAVDDLGVGIDYLSWMPELDRSRVAVLGLSLGSFVATDLAAVDPRVRLVMLISSGGGLGDILEFQKQAFTSAAKTNDALLAQTDAATLDQSLADVDPLTYIPRIAPRPLLMLNGTADQIIPPSAAERLYAAAKQPKQIDWFPGEGHVPTPLGMYASVTVFLHDNMPA
jgi:pimeloyl-ACP methyl ester carboxylesterase